MKRAIFCLATLVGASAIPGFALAAGGSGQASSTEGGIAGDPRGAIRALGGSSQNDFKEQNNVVDVPKLGGNVGVGQVGGTPPGTTGPR